MYRLYQQNGRAGGTEERLRLERSESRKQLADMRFERDESRKQLTDMRFERDESR
jgi:hypothetical protein